MTELSSVADFATPARDTRPGSEEGSQPRVIRQSTSLFLVAEAGELWRVYDSPAPDGVDRQIPDERTQLRYRLFLSLSGPSEIRACRLTDDCPRDVDAVNVAVPGVVNAALTEPTPPDRFSGELTVPSEFVTSTRQAPPPGKCVSVFPNWSSAVTV